MNINDLTADDFVKYLKIYNAPIEWGEHLDQLFKQLNNKANDKVLARMAARKHAAFTILFPTVDASCLTDPPYKLLFYAAKHPQLESKDWGVELCKVIEEDHKIKQVREELATLGTIDPIYYVPRWRQAFSKLMDEVERSGIEVETASTKRYEFLVKCYGGNVINSLFQPQYVKQVGKIPNWRTPYFAERMIHKIYKRDELLKIKTLDLQEIRGVDESKILDVKLSTERKDGGSADDF
jgi:hypothetical protein